MKNFTRLKFLVFALAFIISANSWAQSCYNSVGYTTSWLGSAAAIDYSKYTHVIYSFAIPSADGSIGPIENPGKLQDLVSRGRASNTKVLLAVGGWLSSSPSSTPFEAISTNPTARQRLIDNLANLVTQYNLDGIDMDWEYPTSQSNWNALMVPLGQRIHGMGKLLTAAVAGGAYFGAGFGDLSMLDLVNIMAYDCNCPSNAPYQMAVDATNYWAQRGVPQSKRMLGLPFYSSDNNTALHVQKTNFAKSNAGGIMIWEIDSYGDINSIVSTLGTLCKGNNPPPPPPTTYYPVPGKVEAENYSAMNGIQLEGTTDAGGGQNVGWIDTGDWMDYRVNVASAGSYKVDYRVASQGGGGSIQLRSGSNVLATTPVGNTNGWQTWTTASATVNLSAGQQTLRLYAAAGNFNVNYITFTAGGSNCNATTITPHLSVNGGAWQQTSSATVNAGSSVALGPHPETGGSWSWSGPNFTSTSRQVTISNIQSTGNYVATYTNSCGATSTRTFTITVNGGGGTCSVAAWSASAVYTGGTRVSKNGKVYLANWWTQGEDPEANSCQWCVWKFESNCGSRLSTPDNTTSELKVYPNPLIQGKNLNIALDNLYKEVTVSVQNANGIKSHVFTYKNVKNIELLLSSLPSGMNILKIEADNNVYTRKVMIK